MAEGLEGLWAPGLHHGNVGGLGEGLRLRSKQAGETSVARRMIQVAYWVLARYGGFGAPGRVLLLVRQGVPKKRR